MILQWAVILVLSLLVLSLMRQLGQLALRLNGVKERGEIFAPFSELAEHTLSLVNGEALRFGGGQKRPSLIVFFAPKCSACEHLPGAIKDFVKKHSPEEFALLVVIDIERAAAAKYIAEKSLQSVPIAVLEDFPEHLKPEGVPFAVTITTEGKIAARGKPKNLSHLTEMAELTQNVVEMASPHSRRKHEWGESAPYWSSEPAAERNRA
jgi:hypothetical protein